MERGTGAAVMEDGRVGASGPTACSGPLILWKHLVSCYNGQMLAGPGQMMIFQVLQKLTQNGQFWTYCHLEHHGQKQSVSSRLVS